MSNNKGQELPPGETRTALSNVQILDNIFRSIHKAEIQTPEDARQYLINEGYDPDELVENNLTLIELLRAKLGDGEMISIHLENARKAKRAFDKLQTEEEESALKYILEAIYYVLRAIKEMEG